MSKLDIQEAMQTIGERIVSLASEDDVVKDHLRLPAEELLRSSFASAENVIGNDDGPSAQVNANDSRFLTGKADAELQEIEARCLVRAEGCRWATERVRLREEGADHQIDVARHDRCILDKGRRLPNCDLWMNRPDSPIPNDPSLLKVAGGCFQALSESVAVARLVQTDLSSNRYLLAESLQTVAEAQSALRSSIHESDGGSLSRKYASTDRQRNSNTERPCCAQVAMAVQMRSSHRCPASLREPWVTWRSMTTKRIACSATLLVGSMPGVVIKRR